MEEALTAIWVTTSGKSLHWPANRADCRPIEQTWAIDKASINRE
jgi:hypothetical protein